MQVISVARAGAIGPHLKERPDASLGWIRRRQIGNNNSVILYFLSQFPETVRLHLTSATVWLHTRVCSYATRHFPSHSRPNSQSDNCSDRVAADDAECARRKFSYDTAGRF